MAAYQTIETPLVADKPAGKSLKGLVAGAAAASFVLGALAATAVSSSVAAPTTSFFRPLYVFDQQLGTTTFEECKEKCPTIAEYWHIPCITSFDMNHQLLAWMTKKYGPDKSFAWVGHRDSDWVEPECQAFQDAQFKGDMVKRNGCAFEGDLSKPDCSGSDFDGADGCAVLVNAQTDTGAAALNLPTGPVTSYEQLHGNWIKSTDCESAGLEDDQDEVNCICQKIM